ncbi:RHS repeat-associated core domain-containing protein [Pseudoalteromonas sp. L23]|nr:MULTISPECIES: RHS repeat-associated core domain-containing protein [unclassified Pseudoalteromonas]MCF7516155.1 RHS repeat-associated core domain-containing protein [Pseudoalteromonas sp. L7]MCF7528150.1 RHS repeat-associated core domain-containing protein [Pseudoalteromonas sp. L23]MCX2767017.1 RHS repeat-associated core domain-containing protein [Pseudoalteromonas sp. B530]
MLSSSYGNDSSSYEYDALGRRVKVTTNGVTSIEINGDNESLLWLLEGDGLPVKKVYLGTKLVASEKNSVARYMHFDILGSVIGTSDARRAFSSEEYTPFGEKVKNTTDPQNDQWFTGKRFDTKTGLSYMQARYYDPVIGRFYSNDPIGFRDVHSFNRYAYAANNPYKYTDPTGMCPAESSSRDCVEIGPVKGGGDAKGTPESDQIAVDNAESHRVLTGTVEKASVINQDGSLSQDGVTPKEFGAEFTKDSLKDAQAVIHGHPETKSQDGLNSVGDATFTLSQELPNYVVQGDRIGVTEIENGTLQLRMVKGRLGRKEVKRLKKSFKKQLRKHNK